MFSFLFICFNSCKHPTNSAMRHISKADHLTYTQIPFTFFFIFAKHSLLNRHCITMVLVMKHANCLCQVLKGIYNLVYKYGNLTGKAANQTTKDWEFIGTFFCETFNNNKYAGIIVCCFEPQCSLIPYQNFTPTPISPWGH